MKDGKLGRECGKGIQANYYEDGLESYEQPKFDRPWQGEWVGCSGSGYEGPDRQSELYRFVSLASQKACISITEPP